MSVRKRKWTTSSGEAKEAWVVDYVDASGARRLKTFPRKKEADAFASEADVEVRQGTHVADSASQTVGEAGSRWVAAAERAGLERSTTDQYRQHLNLHIVPFIGREKLSRLSIPSVRAFEDKLRSEGRSPAMVRKILVSLGSLIADAQERGAAARNPVRDMRGKRRGKDRKTERRQKGKLQVGVDIPLPGEAKAIVGQMRGRWRPLLLTAIFTGLRASELRGLRWSDVNFSGAEISVKQRADRFNMIGPPKSDAGTRSVPIPPIVVNALREWKLAAPKGALDLVFPNGAGKVESLANIINRALIPVQIRAGVALPKLDAEGRPVKDSGGQPVLTAKYSGMHALRHFYASWCINRQQEGGLGLPPKVVQERLGHSSITMTMDIYGHLFPRGDDASELAEAERALLA